LVLFDKPLLKLRREHKVLIFTHFPKCLDLLAKYLTFRKHKFERIDDKLCGDHRQAAIDRASTGDALVFLMFLFVEILGMIILLLHILLLFLIIQELGILRMNIL
jgi:hypothetical protein